MTDHKKSPGLPRQFGIFYPRGYVVLALRTAEDAEQVKRALMEGGYAEEEVQVMPMERVLEGASADLEQLNPLVRALGSEAGATEGHLASARAGHSLLIVYAPSNLETERLMNVARRVGYVKAQKYDRFTITEL
jgi:hypothetical protein